MAEDSFDWSAIDPQTGWSEAEKDLIARLAGFAVAAKPSDAQELERYMTKVFRAAARRLRRGDVPDPAPTPTQ